MFPLFVQVHVHQLKPCNTQTVHEDVLGVSQYPIHLIIQVFQCKQYVAIVKITVKLYAISNHH